MTNKDRFIQLGVAISALRKLRGMSQEKLAEKLGVNRERISQIECGRHTPCPFLLREIAKACSVSFESLFDNLDD